MLLHGLKFKGLSSLHLWYNVPVFSQGTPSVAVKRPQSVRFGPLCTRFLVTSAKRALSAATRTCAITYQSEGRLHERMDGWMDEVAWE